MPKRNLSVVLATRNEEENIARCLDSVKSIADEIVIADEQSTDQTVKIAKLYGAKIISVPHHDNFHVTKNKAIDAACGRWILQLDADEVVSPELAAEIKELLSSHPKENGFWINRRNWFLSRFLSKGGQYPDPTIRLYRNGKARLPAVDVHEQAQVTGTVGRLKNDLLHYRDTSFEKYLSGFNRYSSFMANQLLLSNLKFNLFTALNYLFIKPTVTFFAIFVRHRGYVDGFPGFVFALYSGLIHAVAYIKFWQIKYYPE